MLVRVVGWDASVKWEKTIMCTVCTALRIMKVLNTIHVQTYQFVSCNNPPPPHHHHHPIYTLGWTSVSYKSHRNLLKQSVTTCFARMTCPHHQLLHCHECRRQYSELVHSHVFQNCFLSIVYSHFYSKSSCLKINVTLLFSFELVLKLSRPDLALQWSSFSSVLQKVLFPVIISPPSSEYMYCPLSPDGYVHKYTRFESIQMSVARY